MLTACYVEMVYDANVMLNACYFQFRPRVCFNEDFSPALYRPGEMSTGSHQ